MENDLVKTPLLLISSVVIFFRFKSCSLSYFQMGFIQLNQDFLFIEPLNRTLAVTGHAHRVYRRKRSMEEKVSQKHSSHKYCGVLPGRSLPYFTVVFQGQISDNQ